MPEKIQIVLDNHINYLKNNALIEYNPTGEERREFARLISVSGLMTKEEIGDFVQKVRASGSILPDMDIETYYCGVF